MSEHTKCIAVSEHPYCATVSEHIKRTTVSEHPERATMLEHTKHTTVLEHPEVATLSEHTQSMLHCQSTCKACYNVRAHAKRAAMSEHLEQTCYNTQTVERIALYGAK